MITHLAHDLSRAVHDLKGLDFVSTQMVGEKDTHLSQGVVKVASEGLYGVICKEASAYVRGENPLGIKVVGFLKSAAKVLKKDPMPDSMDVKLAAAVTLDETLSSQMKTAEGKDAEKLAEQRAYGREFFLELVREVI